MKLDKGVLAASVFIGFSLSCNILFLSDKIKQSVDDNSSNNESEKMTKAEEKYYKDVQRLTISVLQTEVQCLKSLSERSDENGILWPCVITPHQADDKKKLEEMKKFKDMHIKMNLIGNE